jgi:hypothetical protein
VDQEHKPDQEVVYTQTNVEDHVKVNPPKHDHVEVLLSIPNGEHLEHGVVVQLTAVWEHKHEHVLVLLVMHVVQDVLEMLLRAEHVVKP